MDWLFMGVVVGYSAFALHLNGVLIRRNSDIECLNDKIKMIEKHNKELVRLLGRYHGINISLFVYVGMYNVRLIYS